MYKEKHSIYSVQHYSLFLASTDGSWNAFPMDNGVGWGGADCISVKATMSEVLEVRSCNIS